MPLPILLSVIVVLILLSGLFSGLTIGLYSLNKTELERKAALGNKDAQRVHQVREKGNLLLVSLLLGNVAVNAAISLILGDVAGGLVAGLLATALIVIFGEILPQAGAFRYALEIGSRTAWLVELLIIVFYPIGKPIAWMLDVVLGKEMRTVWSKRELAHIIKMHEDDPRSSVDADEERILLGALTYSDKTAGEVMTPEKEVELINVNQVITQKLLHEIRVEGYTRIPVYEKKKSNIIGLLYTKDLLGVGIGRPLSDFVRKDDLLRVTPIRKLDGLLNMMIVNHTHMAIVTSKGGVFKGIVTLEDVLEEIIGREIEDEVDEQ